MLAEPGHPIRCFEGEQTQLTVWAVTESDDVATDLTLSGAVEDMRIETVEQAAGCRSDGRGGGRPLGPLSHHARR